MKTSVASSQWEQELGTLYMLSSALVVVVGLLGGEVLWTSVVCFSCLRARGWKGTSDKGVLAL